MPRRTFNWTLFGNITAPLCIAALLVAILFPVFQKVHEGGGPSCQSNLKQFSVALIQYNQDYDYAYPSGVNTAGNGWAGQLYLYVKSRRVYRCPNDTHDGAFISYAENQNLIRQKLERLTNPAATVELYEFSTLDCDPSMPEAVSATGLSAPQNSTRHSADLFTLNFLAADGHVRFLRPWQVSGGPAAVGAGALPHGAIAETFAAQ